jgi:predicted site-specific integrase-resolvase
MEKIQKKKIDPYKIYNLQETRQILGIALSTLKKFLKTGELKGKKIGKEWKILGENIIEFLKK